MARNEKIILPRMKIPSHTFFPVRENNISANSAPLRTLREINTSYKKHLCEKLIFIIYSETAVTTFALPLEAIFLHFLF